MRAVIYARYSSDHQRQASIDDQIRLCTSFIEGQDWTITRTYSDQAISGASLLRAGYQSLLDEARRQRYDVLVAEGLDRLSRDQADIATLFKHLAFHGVRIVTVAEGEITELHVGLKGTMNALYLKDLAIRPAAVWRAECVRAGQAAASAMATILCQVTSVHGASTGPKPT